jgi:hypothetical protein
MNFLFGLRGYIMVMTFLVFLFPFFIYMSHAEEVNLTNNSNSTLDKNDNNNVVNQLIQITGVLGSIVIGTFGTRFIVNNWQERKEISEIRKEILKNYQESIVDYLVLMETFVAKIVLRYVSTNDKGVRINRLNELLPYGFTYELPSDFTTKEIHHQTFSFPDRNEKNNQEFLDSEFKKFEQQFLSKRTSVTKFTSGVRQYYQNGKDLYKQLEALWNKIMISHILLHMMMRAQEEKDFISLAKDFKSSIEVCFNDTTELEDALAKAKIKVE